jgi:adenine-specific DNA glycosylase
VVVALGPYTAGAISSIAFGRITGVVDGNVNRVLSRVRAIDTVLGPALDKICWQLINPLVHPERPGHFNQAVMELGATLCKPTSPRCTDCPLQSVCHAYHLTQYNSSHSSKIDDIEDLHVSLPREVTEFPKKAAKKPPKELLFGICVLKMLSRDTDKCDMAGDLTKIKYLFVKRPPKGLLENQWEFPSVLVNPDTMATDHETMSVGQKLKFWLPICQDHLQSELGIGVHHCEKPHQQNEVHHVFRTDDITVHPQPIVHVFSHQRHTMNILEATFNPGLCIAGSIGLSSESARRSLMDPWHTSNASGSREVMWMTLDELKQKGITTGVQKIINTVTASATKLKVNKVKESRLLKKVSTKKCDDSCQKGYDYSASDSQPRKRKITQFFKPA